MWDVSNFSGPREQNRTQTEWDPPYLDIHSKEAIHIVEHLHTDFIEALPTGYKSKLVHTPGFVTIP
jgi:hypothetical protein